jgi:P-type E1-E2 ATPase
MENPQMITVDLPGGAPLRLEHVVFDVNGTLTLDGELLPGVAERIAALRELVAVELLTADTRGRLTALAAALGVKGTIVRASAIGAEKRRYVEQLGASSVAAIGNGMNDVGMLAVAALGIVVVGPEGAAGAALRAADVVALSIGDAFDLLLNPLRLTATLRP